MRAVVAFVLSFVASTLAYQILTPNAQTGWTTTGRQDVTWRRVDTDNLNFTAVLTNQVISGFTPQVLAALVDGTTGETQLSSQNGGFPTGSGFRLDFVVNSQQLDSILAQSDQFDISNNSSTSSTSGTTGSTAITSSPTSPTGISGSSGSSGTSDSSGTSASIIPTSPTSGAASSYPVQTGLLVLFSLLGFTMA